eukprot:5165405-Pleurochrysis_carterae.AAC.1
MESLSLRPFLSSSSLVSRPLRFSSCESHRASATARVDNRGRAKAQGRVCEQIQVPSMGN